MIILDDKTKKFLIDLYQQKNSGLEGNITRFLDVSNDEEFKKLESSLLEKALYSKFTQNDELREILLLTGDALINVFKQTKGASPALELMRVRKLIGK